MTRGYSPVTIYRDGIMYQVIIGNYDNVITPKWIENKIGEDASCEIISLEKMMPIEESSVAAKMANQISSEIRIVKDKGTPLADAAFNPERSEKTEFFNIYENKTIEEAETYLGNLMDSAPLDDPVRGWALLKNGYLQKTFLKKAPLLARRKNPGI